MPRTPGLDTAFRYGVARRQPLKRLVDVGHMEIVLHPIADDRAEGFLLLGLDDKHDLAEASAPGIKE